MATEDTYATECTDENRSVLAVTKDVRLLIMDVKLRRGMKNANEAIMYMAKKSGELDAVEELRQHLVRE